MTQKDTVSVPYEAIKAMLDAGRTTYAAAKRYKVPISVTSRIWAGQEVREYLPMKYRIKKRTGKICSCCKWQPVAKGLKYLCYDCYHGNSEGKAIY